MIAHGNQTLTYDEQNQLAQVSKAGSTVTFGYGDDGERLWRNGPEGYSIWIGGIYEVNAGRVLCHVFANGQRIASFEPQCGGLWSTILGERRWYEVSSWLGMATSWPLQQGRTPLTFLVWSLTCILGVCMAARRQCGVRWRSSWRPARAVWRPASLWRQAVTVALLPALLLMTTQTNVEAATAGPLFYYYLPDHLGSSNVILDRQGNVVQQYQYGTFGNTAFTGSATAYPVSNRYTDQIMDDDTGLYYYGGRYFDPQLGRFIQPDPTVPNPCDPQSLNRYSYVRNNPLNLSDPSGYDDVPSDSPDPFPSGGGDLFGGGDSPPAQAEMPPTQAANGSSFLSANWGWSTSGLTTTYSGSITLGSPGIGFVTWAGSITTSLTAGIEDDGMMLQGRPVVDSVSFGVSYQPPTSLAVESGQTGGGWLSGVTNAAGWLSMIPGPVGAAASGINAVGEAMQGHWGQAALAVGGIALAAVGAGVVTQFGRAARVVKVEQYALRAADNGFYPVMIRGAEDPQFLTYLEKGDAWKFGTTKNPATRYSQAYLHSVGEHGVEYSTEFSGTSREALTVQKMKIQNVRSQSGRLPPGNKIVN